MDTIAFQPFSHSSYPVYTLCSARHKPKPIFVWIFLFNVLRYATIVFPSSPYILVSCASVAESFSKLQQSFTADELLSWQDSAHAFDQRRIRDRGLDIVEVHTALSWNSEIDDRPILTGHSVDLPLGSLVAVIGNKGSGKSTILSELPSATSIGSSHAELLCAWTVAFCDQFTSIQNWTVREYIMFCKPSD